MPDKQHRDALDRLEAATERVIGRAEYETANRASLLWVHGIVGFVASIQMVVWGSASSIETAVGIWVRPVIAFIGLVGGWALMLGLARRPRSLRLETVGLVCLLVFDLLILLGLAYARLKQHDWHPLPIGEPIPLGYVVAYPVSIYGGLAALIVIHLRTLGRIRKATHP